MQESPKEAIDLWRGVAVGCRVSLEGFRAGKRQKLLLMWLDGCKMGWFGGF